MPTEKAEKKRRILPRWFMLCPARHILLLASSAVIITYFLLRKYSRLMTTVCEFFTRPWHRFYGKLCSFCPVSVAALLIAATVIAVIVYILATLISALHRRGLAVGLYRIFITLAAVVVTVYALFCVLWGTYYYTSDFEANSGIYARPVSVEELQCVTEYFARMANEYSSRVERGEDGLFSEDLDSIFACSPQLYDKVQEHFPCLEGPALAAKPFLFSRAMSYINFTGFFFPFTGEANINVDAPACLIPSTIAHEIAHQRGVAAEDEANFVAVLSSLESGNDVYTYSAALLAYIHLSNALYSADLDAWQQVSALIGDAVRADLDCNNKYWEKYETPISDVSDTVYTGFLQSYGQTLGLKSYGACVDLLTVYYLDFAKEG